VSGLARISRGSYADTSGLSAEAKHLLTARAVLSAVGNVALSHTTAATNWGLPVQPTTLARVHVSPLVDRRGKPGHGPEYHMHTRRIDPADLRDQNGLATTSPLRTVLDCARWLDPDWGVAVADCALHNRLITAEDLERAAAGIRRLRGAERARALPTRSSILAESVGETLLRLRLLRMGLTPVEQVAMPWVEGNPRVDFLIEGWLVVEFDGRGKYEIGGDPAGAHWAEKVRDNHLVDWGYTVAHVIWAQLWDETRLARRINMLLARGPSTRWPGPSSAERDSASRLPRTSA
jgi:hypothetical protein